MKRAVRTSQAYRLTTTLAVAMMTVVACVDIIEPPAPDVFIQGDATGENTQCNCTPEDVTGRAYRFTRLTVDQPARLNVTLDSMWEYEISNYLLNVLFVVDIAEADDDELAAFSRLQLSVGPAWRTPSTGYSNDDFSTIESYCFMDESLNIGVDVIPSNGYQCRFRNTEAQTLYFHLGPQTDPLMCAPLLSPANSTPIHDLHVTFGFNENCSQISSGHLEGCLPQESVNQICMCIKAGLCSKDGALPETGFPTPPEDPFESFSVEAISGYCASACGQNGNWATFRGIMDAAEIVPSCVTADGRIGYRLSAFFEAEDVTSLFRNTMSADCTGV